MDKLTGHGERGLASREDPRAGVCIKQPVDLRTDCIEEMFAVVDHHQGGAISEPVDECVLCRLPSSVTDAESIGHRVR
jgi:hypothetical protein